MPLSNSHNSSKALFVIFILLTFCLSFGGYILYLHQKKNITLEKHNELAAINKLKIEQIVNWRNNLLVDANTIYYNQPVITHIHELNLGINSKANYQIVSKWTESLLKEFDYTNALLVNPAGKVIVNTNPGEPLTENGKGIITQSIQKKDISISDLIWCNEKTICMLIAVPLYLEVENHELFSGVALLNINPKKYFFPLIQSWPTPSLTGETMIYRREGDSVLVLNELRHYKNGALRLRKPMTDTLLPAIRAAMGNRGIIEGVDYRNIRILADVDTIPDTKWFIVTKIDIDEIYQPIHKQAFWMFSLTFLLIFVCAFIIYTIWKSQSTKSEQERLALLKHFDYLVKYANDIIILTDFKGNIYETNDKTVSAYGYSRDEMLKMNITQLRPPETKGAIDKLFGLLDENDGFLYETLHVRKNGEIFPIESSGRSMDVDGIKYYQFIIRDITERKKIEEALIKSKEKAEESDRLKTAFLYNISHEIRTPFNGILGFLSILQDHDLSDDEREEYTGIINQSADRLMNTINDIVEISQIQAGQMQVTVSEINIKMLTGELADQFKPFIESKKLKFNINNELPDNLTVIFTDSIKLKAILSNLVGNAFKFTKAGSIELEIRQKGDYLEFSIKDSGIGFPENKIKVIFERFMQADVSKTREFEGLGLGLSIATAYVKMLGGEIWAKSEEGKGSTFFFTIKCNIKPE